MARRQVKKNASKRIYAMTVAGQLFNHLGLQMYSGAVPAISEFISNAYDAMARNVWVTIPIGRPIRPTDQIIIEDDGHGMSFEECNSFYLMVGRNRRSNQSEWTKEYNGLTPRKVQGRKGIGKLAGFGVANIIDVRTIKEKEVSHFKLDFEDITKSSEFAVAQGYKPDALPDDGENTDEDPGSITTLSQLKISRAINEREFKRSIARRLLVLDDNFIVHVNGEPITRQEIPFQFRFPKKVGEWKTAELENGQQIQWWAGFCKDTIPDEEQRGFVVYVRGKLAQTPWFFDLSGGVWGQHGMQYLTGEVQADFLDGVEDLIATDRGTIRWEDPTAVPLKKWGRKKIKELLESWADKRRKEKIKSPKIIRYLEQAENLPKKENRIFKTVVNRICSIPHLDKDEDGEDIADELVAFVYNALTNRNFLETIRTLTDAPTQDIERFTEILSEWDIIEAVNTAHLVKGRLEIIRKFKQMIDDKVPEKPDMQDYLKEHPWLIDPKWTMLAHEKSLDKLIREEFNLPSSGEEEGRQRVDFFCLGDSQTAYVVEVKRPGVTAGKNEFAKLSDYVVFLREKLMNESTAGDYRRSVVKGMLIAGGVRRGHEGHLKVFTPETFDFRTWGNLLETAETMHDRFFEVVKSRAPADDPRMKELSTNIPEGDIRPLDAGEKRKTKKRLRTKKK
ncbi:MAG: hypothetical protein F4Y78_06645 [Candidatus Dadabacteria bacterium]|nr:hypothetical protein [Candidatus Dadabacteria bacterium]MYA48782.1 hypothetical protein [Candidatus Dadabacteria bacterium]MYG82356.1 hypothetical protein [Candidatus Dadabacteria bacterium]MYK49342.1 hypothetical protein [Candidatus Dadabacteria bacterium]